MNFSLCLLLYIEQTILEKNTITDKMILNQHNVRNELYMTELVDLDFRPIARVFTPNNGHVLAMVFRIAK